MTKAKNFKDTATLSKNNGHKEADKPLLRKSKGKEAIKEHILTVDPTKNYQATHFNYFGELVVSNLPQWRLWTGRVMLTSDPIVNFSLNVRNAALMAAEIEIICNNPRIAQWLQEQWDFLWSQHRSKLVSAKKFGFQALQVLFKMKKGLVCIKGVKDFAPEDCRALEVEGRIVGERVKGSKVYNPQALWLTFGAEFGSAYGIGCLRRSYPAWYEKWMDHGAKRLLQLRMIKDSYIGDIFWYPPNMIIETPDGTKMSWRDLMRELGENRLSGGALTMPMLYDSSGKELTKYTPPQDTGTGMQIFEWNDHCDENILRGADIPIEVVKASETGSGYSGRSIPFMVVLSVCTQELTEIIQRVDEQVLRPLAWLNFGGDPDYEIRPRSLVESFSADTSGSAMGGSAIGTQAGAAPPPQQLVQGQQYSEAPASDFVVKRKSDGKYHAPTSRSAWGWHTNVNRAYVYPKGSHERILKHVQELHRDNWRYTKGLKEGEEFEFEPVQTKFSQHSEQGPKQYVEGLYHADQVDDPESHKDFHQLVRAHKGKVYQSHGGKHLFRIPTNHGNLSDFHAAAEDNGHTQGHHYDMEYDKPAEHALNKHGYKILPGHNDLSLVTVYHKLGPDGSHSSGHSIHVRNDGSGFTAYGGHSKYPGQYPTGENHDLGKLLSKAHGKLKAVEIKASQHAEQYGEDDTGMYNSLDEAVKHHGPVLASSEQDGYKLRIHAHPHTANQPGDFRVKGHVDSVPYAKQGQMTVEHPSGHIVKTGYWMDWAERHYPKNYTKLPREQRAQLEANEQIRYGHKHTYNFHRTLHEGGNPAYKINQYDESSSSQESTEHQFDEIDWEAEHIKKQVQEYHAKPLNEAIKEKHRLHEEHRKALEATYSNKVPALNAHLENEVKNASTRARIAGYAVSKHPHYNPLKPDSEQMSETEHKYSSTQFNLPGELAFEVRQLGDRIEHTDLWVDGKELNPHVTVKYGLHTNEVEDIRKVVQDLAPVAIQLGACSYFESEDHDVVKIDVISQGLHNLNKAISDAVPHTDTYPDYKPHITIAYVKKGLGAHYAKKLNDLHGKVAVFDRLIFSNRNREHHPIPLTGLAQFKEKEGG